MHLKISSSDSVFGSFLSIVLSEESQDACIHFKFKTNQTNIRCREGGVKLTFSLPCGDSKSN